MSILHVKSDTIGDFTGTVTAFDSAGVAVSVAATDLVRPSDWNSAHNQVITLTGNTFSNSTASGTNLIWAGSGGVSIGGSGASVIVSGNTGGGGGSVNFSAGTTSNNLGSVVFSNSNGLSFGLNGSTITGSYTVPSTAGLLSNINVSAGTTSNNLSAITFSNSNGVTFGLNGSVITATVQPGAAAGIAALGAGTQTATSGTVDFANSNGISFGMSGSTQVTASYTVPSTAGLLSAINVSAGTTSNNLSAFTLSNSNNVSFGLSGSVVTGSASFAQSSQSAINALGATNTGNTSGNTGVSTGVDWVVAGSNRITINESTTVGGPNTLWIDNGTAGGGGATLSWWANDIAASVGAVRQSNLSGSIFPFTLACPVAFSDIVVGWSISAATAANTSTAYVEHTLSAVLYSLNASTLSSINSGNVQGGTVWNSNATSAVVGPRLTNIVLGSSTVLTQGNYWLALILSTTNSSTDGATATTALGNSITMLGVGGLQSNIYAAESYGQASSLNTRGLFSGAGLIGNTTSGTYGMGAITGGISAGNGICLMQLRNTSVY